MSNIKDFGTKSKESKKLMKKIIPLPTLVESNITSIIELIPSSLMSGKTEITSSTSSKDLLQKKIRYLI